MAINNNLYPPIIETYNPAFLINSGNIVKDTCRIYFSISLYNSFSDIANAQVTVSYQNNNKSALNETLYPCDIMLTPIRIDSGRAGNDKYYIEIKSSDIQNGFEINQYYKVQIRFTAAGAPSVSLSTPQALDSWLAANLGLFSEWSIICLIRGISAPRLEVNGLESSAETTIWSSAESRIVGTLTFADPMETEILKSYRIKLYNANTEELISDSDIQYTNDFTDPNQFNYTFPYAFVEAEDYHLVIEYVTNDLYTGTEEYNFSVIQTSGGEKLNATISAEIDNEDGLIIVKIKSKTTGSPFVGNVTIRRTSSLSNFTLWEDVYTVTIEDNKDLNIEWADYTAESGVWYSYCAQKRDSLGNRGVILKLDEPVMLDLEYFYLAAAGQQIKLKFDHAISSFKHQIAESKVDTLGSKYPFIKRNGAVDYRTFPITARITHFMDEKHIFTSREDVFGENIELYNKYNDENNITPFNDYIYERRFREKVIDFLYKHNVKLFRSATEGNILVKLMDLNFTPEPVLGGYIYSFSCTAYEVADCTQENLDKYDIQPVEDYSTNLSYHKDYFGQSQQVFNANEDVIETLQKEYQQYAKEKYVTNIEYLDSLRLEFESPPYLIGEDDSGPYVIRDSNTRAAVDLSSAYLGYLVYINGQPIVINPEGIYELRQDNVQITSLYFPVNTQVNLEYHLQLNQTEDFSQLYKSTNYFDRVGQYWGTFGYNDSIYEAIFNKYYEIYPDYLQSLVSLNKIKVEADPGTVVYVKEEQDDDFERHVIGPTCTLDFGDDESVIEGIYFTGIHLEPANDIEKERENLPDNKYIETGITFSDFSEITNPIKNGVYTYAERVVDAIDTIEPDKIFVDEDDIEETGRELPSAIFGIDPVQIDEKANQISVADKDIEKTGDKIFTLVLDKNGGLVPYAIDEPREQVVVKSDDTQNRIIDPYYRLLLHHVYDKEFALFMEELLDNTKKYIYYNGRWLKFTDNGDLIYPVEGLIDYYCEIMKGHYTV